MVCVTITWQLRCKSNWEVNRTHYSYYYTYFTCAWKLAFQYGLICQVVCDDEIFLTQRNYTTTKFKSIWTISYIYDYKCYWQWKLKFSFIKSVYFWNIFTLIFIVEYFSNAPFLKNNGAFKQKYEVTGGFQ